LGSITGTAPVTVSVNIAGLTPGTVYHYRLVASNANGKVKGTDRTFVAPMRPTVTEESAAEVSSTSATLSAQIDPGGAQSTARIEYGTTLAYGASIPIPEGEVGSGLVAATVSGHLQGLTPSTVYHYRFVAGNTVQREIDGRDQTFTTQTLGAFALPDARQWELVTPPNKHGAEVHAISGEALIEAAPSGDAIGYPVSAPTEDEPAGNSNDTEVLSDRGASGWETEDLAVPHLAATGASIQAGREYRFFSEDLSSAVIQPFGEFDPQLSPEASAQTPFIHDDFSIGEP